MPRPTPEQRAMLEGAADRIAAAHQIDGRLLKLMVTQESGWDPSIVNHETQATGLGQIRPALWKTLADPGWSMTDPIANLTVAARFTKQLSDKYKDPLSVVGAYHAGETNWDRWVEQGKPPGPKTQEHMRQVFARLPTQALTPDEALQRRQFQAEEAVEFTPRSSAEEEAEHAEFLQDLGKGLGVSVLVGVGATGGAAMASRLAARAIPNAMRAVPSLARIIGGMTGAAGTEEVATRYVHGRPPTNLERTLTAATTAGTQGFLELTGGLLADREFASVGRNLKSLFGGKVTLPSGAVPSAAQGGEQARLGYEAIRTTLPHVRRTMVDTKRALYATEAKQAAGAKLSTPVRSDMVDWVKGALDELGEPSVVPGQGSKVKKTLEEFLERLAPSPTKKDVFRPVEFEPGSGVMVPRRETIQVAGKGPAPLTYGDVLKYEQQIRDELPGYFSATRRKLSNSKLGELHGNLNKELDRMASGVRPVEEARRTANEFFVNDWLPYSRAERQIDSGTGMNAGDLMQVLRQQPRTLQRTLNALDKNDPAFADKLRVAWFQDHIADSLDEFGNLDARRLLARWRATPAGARHAVAGPQTADVDRFFRTLGPMARRQQLVRQGAAFSGAASTVGSLGFAIHEFKQGNFENGVIALAAAPLSYRLMPYLLSRPGAVRLLERGIRAESMRPGSRALARFGSQFITQAGLQTIVLPALAAEEQPQPTPSPAVPQPMPVLGGPQTVEASGVEQNVGEQRQ